MLKTVNRPRHKPEPGHGSLKPRACIGCRGRISSRREPINQCSTHDAEYMSVHRFSSSKILAMSEASIYVHIRRRMPVHIRQDRGLAAVYPWTRGGTTLPRSSGLPLLWALTYRVLPLEEPLRPVWDHRAGRGLAEDSPISGPTVKSGSQSTPCTSAPRVTPVSAGRSSACSCSGDHRYAQDPWCRSPRPTGDLQCCGFRR